MKHPGHIHPSFIIASAALVCAAPIQSSAQSLQEVMPKGIKEMKEGKFAEAQQTFSDFTSNFEMERGERLFGGYFGSAYYYQGRSELSLASSFARAGGAENSAKSKEFYAKAKESFGNCYSINSTESKKNKQQKMALLYKGQACQALGEFRDAIDLYEKFLKERAKTDKFSVGMYHVNLAVCNFQLPNPELKSGMAAFETALKNRERWKINDTAILNAFQAFSQAVITAKSESSMVDFLNQNRAVLTLKPYQMVEFTPFFQKLASEAVKADMVEAGCNLLALVPSTETAIAEAEGISEQIKNLPVSKFQNGSDVIDKARLERALSTLNERVSSGEPPEVMALGVMAVVNEKNGYLRGAYAVYDQLERYYKKSKKRESNLFNLFRIGANLGRNAESEVNGRTFLKNFANSENAETVRVLILSNIFQSGDYEKAKATASEWLDEVPKDSLQHDVCLHVLAASSFYLGDYELAVPYLEEHCNSYPESKFAPTSNYLRASSFSQLQQWDEAAKYLTDFIGKFADPEKNIYLPYALFDLANVYFMKQDFDNAIVYLGRVEKEFPSSNIVGAAFNLKGNILQSQESEDQAFDYFKKSLQMAKNNGSAGDEAESLFYLISLLGDKGVAKAAGAKQEDVLPYFDSFWSKYKNTPYLVQVSVSASEALAAAGRYEVLLEALKHSISAGAKSKNSLALVSAIENYSIYFIENETKNGVSEVDAAEKLRLVYYKFPDVDANDARTQAMLRVALIGAYEATYQHAVTAKDEGLMSKTKGRITATFKDLKANYPVASLSDFVLIKIGDYLRTKSAAPRQALPYYEELVVRKKGEYLLDAEFGVADVLGVAGSAEEVVKAIDLLTNIEGSNPDNKEISSKAKSRIVKIYAKQQSWDKVIVSGREYLANYRKDKEQKLGVQQLLAQAYDKTNSYNDCIAINMGIFGSNTTNWQVSVPAISRATELMWDHGTDKPTKSRKQAAYEVAGRYIKSSRPAFDKFKDSMTDDVRSSWRGLDRRVQQWEDSGQIKTFAQLDAERLNK